MIIYQRSTRLVTDHRKVVGRRGTVQIKWITGSWGTIERCRDQECTPLPAGLYEAEMGYMTTRSGRKLESIRLLGRATRGRYYLHLANWPFQLHGCISPGLAELAGGVANSKAAMDRILAALGGFEDRKPLPSGFIILDPPLPPLGGESA